jgi:2-succinyl-5-enolpyruvyl-6-hydroxy-3-cyclohexene-1-carboxylate synthase
MVFAEAASGLREHAALHDRLIRCGDATLRHLQLKSVTRCGGVPSVRFWRDVDPHAIAVGSCSRSGYVGLPWSRELHRMDDLIEFARLGPDNPADRILSRDAELYRRLGDILTQFPNSEPALFRRLSQVIPGGATVFTGNSLPVREWNLCAEYGRGHRVHVLRGANGIDGNLSAFLGVAADKPESWCLVGDLTALYDLNAPWMLPQLPPGRRRFVVIQNRGGKIFSRLPALRELNDRERTLMENPHDIRLRGWAEMWGMDHLSGGAEVLENAAVLNSLADHGVIELYPDAEQTESFWSAWAEAEREVWGS